MSVVKTASDTTGAKLNYDMGVSVCWVKSDQGLNLKSWIFALKLWVMSSHKWADFHNRWVQVKLAAQVLVFVTSDLSFMSPL